MTQQKLDAIQERADGAERIHTLPAFANQINALTTERDQLRAELAELKRDWKDQKDACDAIGAENEQLRNLVVKLRGALFQIGQVADANMSGAAIRSFSSTLVNIKKRCESARLL